ncbi:MAG: hypothetical protein IAF38_21965 [Bacteroidia bacterium]|nr:hypothetical protein [Bacteroidia bacterium]
MKKIYLIASFIFSLLTEVNAQAPASQLTSGKELNVLMRNEASGGLFVHSRGFGLNYRRARHVTGMRKRVFEMDLLTMHHPKEVKVSRTENSKGYYYGKLNSLVLFRPGIGFQNVLFRRGERKSVEIRYSTFIGGSICLAKPVYLDIVHNIPNSEQKPVTTEQYDPEKHNQSNINGRAPFFTGFNKSKLYPGGYAKFAISCEYADNSDDIKALELGTVIDVYPKAIPIMATKTNSPFFLTIYANFIFGKKWF